MDGWRGTLVPASPAEMQATIGELLGLIASNSPNDLRARERPSQTGPRGGAGVRSRFEVRPGRKRYDAAMSVPPAVWTVAPGADEDQVGDVVGRLAERLGIEKPQITNGMVLLPPEYPTVARALDEVHPDWRDESLLIPPVA
jgi:hypothetical protein